MRAFCGHPRRVLPHETSFVDDGAATPPGRPEAARVVWRWDAPAPPPEAPPRRHLVGPVAGLALGIALALTGRRNAATMALSASTLALTLEVLRPALAARAREALAKALTVALLAVAYVALFTPLRLLRRRDTLHLDPPHDAQSFWMKRDGRAHDAERLF